MMSVESLSSAGRCSAGPTISGCFPSATSPTLAESMFVRYLASISWNGTTLGDLSGAAIGVLAALLCASCGGSVPKTLYYTLEMAAPPLPADDSKTSFVLGVEHFRAPEILHDDRIVYYKSPTELSFYDYHRWSSNPATLLAQLVARRLRDSGTFAHVRLWPGREPVDYTLRGHLFNFDEVDYEGTKGRVSLELTLVRWRDRKVVWSAKSQAERPAEGSGVAGVVKGINAASEELLHEVLPGLVAQVESDFKELEQSKENPPPKQ